MTETNKSQGLGHVRAAHKRTFCEWVTLPLTFPRPAITLQNRLTNYRNYDNTFLIHVL